MNKILTAALTIALMCGASLPSMAAQPADPASPLPVKVLVLPKFEIGEMTGDFPGEAQYYYEQYLNGAEEYDVPYGPEGSKLYYRDGVALCLLGIGKVNAALGTMAILSDERFDYSQAYILDTGCAGSAAETTVTGDNYWKGAHGHENALLMAETYQCPDPYVTTEMEDVAVARTAERMGMLDRLIILRDSVNMDVFMAGATPESLWGDGEMPLSSEDSPEAADIFAAAMKNNFDVGRIIIDRILDKPDL